MTTVRVERFVYDDVIVRTHAERPAHAARRLAFRWAARSGQLDDLETPRFRIFHDDPPGARVVNSDVGRSHH